MSKVCIVGDLHLSPRTPVSRKDNYPETLLNKLDSLLSLCKDNNVSDCIFLGDLLNANQMTMDYFIKVYKHFLDFAARGIKLHLIIGNHDIKHDNQEFIDKSPIALLIDSGLFNKDNFSVDDTNFYLYNYFQDVSSIDSVSPETYNVLIGHYFYLHGFNDEKHTLTKEMCSSLGFKQYFLGHDHTPYSPVISSFQVHRPGSFSRASSQTCQLNRDSIQVCLYDTSKHSVDYLNIPNILPSKEVYSESRLLNKVIGKTDFQDLIDTFDELINDFNLNSSQDIYAVIDGLEMNDTIRDMIISYLHNEGIYKEVSFDE